MDLIDKVNATDFLGSEFLLWLWFASDVCESELPIATRDDAGSQQQVIGIWLDDQLVLFHPAAPTEKATLKGMAPSATPEAKEALRQGKLPQRAHLGLRIGEREWGLTLDAATLGLSGVKLPELLGGPDGAGDGDEIFYERMALLDQLQDVMGALFERFARLRLSRSFGQTTLPLMRAWIAESKAFDPVAAKRTVLRALK